MDNSDFKNLFQDIKPIKNKKYPLPPRKKSKLFKKKPDSTVNNHEYKLSDQSVNNLLPEMYLEYKQLSISEQNFSLLRKGKYAVEATIDLHGYSIDQARTKLADFIFLCREKQLICVKIIHGKSHSGYKKNNITLKSLLAHWLKQIPDVLAYCSCLPADGGCGAIYVLVKRLKNKLVSPEK